MEGNQREVIRLTKMVCLVNEVFKDIFTIAIHKVNHVFHPKYKWSHLKSFRTNLNDFFFHQALVFKKARDKVKFS